jgi:hypothetical protein
LANMPGRVDAPNGPVVAPLAAICQAVSDGGGGGGAAWAACGDAICPQGPACPMTIPMPMPIPAPAAPGLAAAVVIASAALNCAYLFRSPARPTEVRLSSTFSTSSGSEMFSM